jgi:hypothetical protein
MRKLIFLLVAAAIAVLGGGPAGASPNAAKGQPDILVLVYSGMGNNDQVGLTYPKTTSHSQVQRDLSQVQSLTGWAESNVKISDDAFKGDKMTSAQFVTHPILQPGSQTLPLEQIVTALRSYPRVSVVYFLAGQMDFKGLRDYTDNNVDVHFEQRGNAYTYHVRILNPNFDRLNLPQLQPTATSIAQQPAPSRRRIRPWEVLLLAVLAAGAGVAVYVITSRRP